MSIEFDQKTKTYSARVRIMVDGKVVHKRSPRYKTKREAKEAEASIRDQHHIKTIERAPKKALDYLTIRDEYLKSKSIDTKESSRFTIIHEFAKHIDPYFSKFDLTDLHLEDLRQWQENLWSSDNGRGGKLSYASCKKIRSIFFTFLNYVEFYYEIPNLLRRIKIPKRIEQRREIAFWEPDEFNRFLECVDNYTYKVMFTLDYNTGARIGEILALKNEDVTDYITLNKTYTSKTMDKAPYKITPIKNYQNRKNELPKSIADMVRDYKKWKKEHRLDGDYLFGGADPIPYNTVLHRFNKYKKAADLQTDSTIHGFRHAYVSCLRKLGLSSKVVAKLIGDTEEQVIRTYSHIFNEDLALAAKMMENLINVPKMYPNS